jgi:adenosine deaminase
MHDIWISGNMEEVYKYCGFNQSEMVQLARNAVDMSWADDSIKAELYAELKGVVCSNP